MFNALRRVFMLGASLALALPAVIQWAPLTGRALAPKLTGVWSQVGVPALNGQAVALADDPGRGQLIAVVSSGGRLATAVLHGSTWQLSAAPPAAPDSLFYDPALGAVVESAAMCAATWNGTTWSALSCAPVQGGVVYFARAGAYDGNRGVVLVVADTNVGNCCLSEYGDTETWAWNGVTWRDLSPAHEPAPVVAQEPGLGCPDPACLTVVPETVFPETGSATWDAAHGKVVLVGDGNRTWTWNGSDWSGGVAPALSAVSPPSLAYSAEAGAVMGFGLPARTSTWSGLVWEPVTTEGLPPLSGPIADDAHLGGLVLLGQAVGAGRVAQLWRLTPGV